MNADLPSTMGEFLALLVEGIVGSFLDLTTVGTVAEGLMLAAAITTACTVVSAFAHGTDEDSPILTESERQETRP